MISIEISKTTGMTHFTEPVDSFETGAFGFLGKTWPYNFAYQEF